MIRWKAHTAKIRSVAFSPDGRLLATASGGAKSAYLWDATTGTFARKLAAGNIVQSVAFAPVAPLFVAGVNNGVRVWRTDTWNVLADLYSGGDTQQVAFGPGPRPLLAVSSVNDAIVWADLDAGERRPREHLSIRLGCGAPCLDFSPDGKLLAVHSPATLWNLTTRKEVRRFDCSGCGFPVRFTPDGERIAFAYHGWVEIHLTEGDGPPVTIRAGTGNAPQVWGLGWSRDGRVLTTAGYDGHARMWDGKTGKELRAFDWGIGKVRCAAFSPEGSTCAAGGEKGQVVVWDEEG